MGRGVINSLPSLGLQVIRTKVSLSLQYEKQTSHSVLSPSDLLQYHPLPALRLKLWRAKNDWCSGFRNQSPGNVEYLRPATVQWSLHMSSVRECSWYKKTKACLEFVATLGCVCSLSLSIYIYIYNLHMVMWGFMPAFSATNRQPYGFI